jgi:hypothetical protein
LGVWGTRTLVLTLRPTGPDFFCHATLLYVAPPPDGHEELYVQLITHVLKTTKVTFGVVVMALRYYDMYTRLAAEHAADATGTAPGTAATADPAGAEVTNTSSTGTDPAAAAAAAATAPKLAGQVRFIIAALMTAAKFLDDVTYGNRSWSVVSGIPQAELTAAEITMLDVLAYHLHMRVADFTQWMARLHTITSHLEAHRFARLAARTNVNGGNGNGSSSSSRGGGVQAAPVPTANGPPPAVAETRARLLMITRQPLERPAPFPIYDFPRTPQLPVVAIVVAGTLAGTGAGSPTDGTPISPDQPVGSGKGKAAGGLPTRSVSLRPRPNPNPPAPTEPRRATVPDASMLVPPSVPAVAARSPRKPRPTTSAAAISERRSSLGGVLTGQDYDAQHSPRAAPLIAAAPTGRRRRRAGSSGIDAAANVTTSPPETAAAATSAAGVTSSSLMHGLQAGFTLVLRSLRQILPDAGSPERDSGIGSEADEKEPAAVSARGN